MTRRKCIFRQPADGASQDRKRHDERAAGEHGASVHENATMPKKAQRLLLQLYESATGSEHDGSNMHSVQNGSIQDGGEDVRRFEQHHFDVFARIDVLRGKSPSALGHEKVCA